MIGTEMEARGATGRTSGARQTPFVATLVLLALAGLACGPLANLYPPNISGAWHGEYEDDLVTMDFDTSGDVWLYVGDDQTHGEYEVNFDVEPHHLDITFDDGSRVETIFEFVDDNTIRMENNGPDEARATEFADFIELSQ